MLSDTEVASFYRFGIAQYKAQDWGKAADAFRLLCTSRPLEPKFWFALGLTLQQAGSFQEAIGSWSMTALLSKDDPYPYFHAAECHFSLEQPRDGSKALQEASRRIQKAAHPLTSRIQTLQQQWRP